MSNAETRTSYETWRHRHPAHVTADRLKAHYERWYERLDGREHDDFSRVIQILEEIGDGERHD